MMLLFCKKTTSCSFDPFFSFPCRGGTEGAFLFFVKTKGRSLLFRLKKVKKSTTWLFRNRRLTRRERKKKIR